MYRCPMMTFFYANNLYYRMWLENQRNFINNYSPSSIDLRVYPNYEEEGFRHCSGSSEMGKSEVDLMNHMRMLWEQHIVWTRMAIISIIENSPDEDLVVQRLLRNPIDFEKIFKNFYGEKIAAQFKDLFTKHLVIAAELVKAAKAGDSEAAADAQKRWYENADEIATFFSNINPYWSEELWKTMMHKHLELTKSEALAILNKNYADSIQLYDEIEKQVLEMADIITMGIIKQFFNK